MNVLQLLGGQALRAFRLRNDLVGAAVQIEAIDEVAAKHRRQVRADLLHVDPHRRDLIAVEDDLRLRLIDPHIADGRERELPALDRLLRELLGKAEDLIVAGRRLDHEFHREESGARKGRWQESRRPNARDARELECKLLLNWKNASLAFVP